MPIKTLPQEEPQLNLTPMIDVILTLIIFFMVATKFAEEERAIDLKLPETQQTAQVAATVQPRVVNVRDDGSIFLGQRPVGLEQLTDELKALRKTQSKISVVVRGDRAVSHGRMADIYAAVRAAGVPELGIATANVDSIRK